MNGAGPLHNIITLHHDKVLIVDFGSQVTQLIARRVRETASIARMRASKTPKRRLYLQITLLQPQGDLMNISNRLN